MKKGILIAVIAVSALSSCRKIRTCECNYTSGSVSYTDTQTTPYAMTKSNATTWCAARADGYYYTSCTLK